MAVPHIESFAQAAALYDERPHDAEGRVLLVRRLKTVPPTVLEHPDVDTYVIRMGEIPLVTYQRTGRVTLNAGPERTELIAKRLRQFSPFDIFSRIAFSPWVAHLEHAGAPGGYVNGRYRRGWMFKNNMSATPIDARVDEYRRWTVEGATTLQEAEEIRYARDNLERYAGNYVEALWYTDLRRTNCPLCRFEVNGLPLGDVLKVQRHWLQHIGGNEYPPSLAPRAVRLVRPKELRRRLATLIYRALNAEPEKKMTKWGYPERVKTVEVSPEEHRALALAIIAYVSPRTQERV